MFVMPIGGGGYTPPPPPPPPKPPVPPQTQQYVGQQTQSSLSSAQTATTTYEGAVNSGAPQSVINQDYNTMINKWGTYEFWLQEQMRIARLSGGKSAVRSQAAGITGKFNGDGYTSGILGQAVKIAEGQVLAESTPHSVTELALATSAADGQAISTATQVQAIDERLPAGIKDNDPDIDTEASQAVTQAELNYINSITTIRNDLIKELGLSGNFTDAQLTAAVQRLQNSYQGQGLDSLIAAIGAEAEINRNLTYLNPNSPLLGPIGEKLLETDRPLLAFSEATGVSLNPKDYNTTDPKAANYLSPQDVQLMSADPRAFTLMRLAHMSVGIASNGIGVQVFIDGKPVPLSASLSDLAKNGQVGALVTSLVNQTQWSPNIQALMTATDLARLNYVSGRLKVMMSGPHPDALAALKFLTTNMNEMFSESSGVVLWQQVGLQYFNQQWVAKQIDQILQKPNPLSSNPQQRAELMSTEINADKVGQWIQQVIPNAPPELATIIVSTVESKFSNAWYQSNQVNPMGGTTQFAQFYQGLSMAVELGSELDSNLPSQVAHWLLDRSAPQGGLLYQMNAATGGLEVIRQSAADGYPLLSEALDPSIPSQMHFMFDTMLQQGASILLNKYMNSINGQQYQSFLNNPSAVLKPYFNSFPKYLQIGSPQKIESNTQLDDLIGTALGLAPSDAAAAKAGDFSKAWYQPKTENWNIIQVVADWIHEEGGENPTVTLVPVINASPQAGVSPGALIQVATPNGSDEIVDAMAAEAAVEANGGAMINPYDASVQWKYSSFQNYQDNNQISGDLYLPSNFQTSAGSTVLTADVSSANGQVGWTRYSAHIVTTGARFEQIGEYVAAGLAVVGGGLLIVASGGLLAAPVAAVVGAVGSGMFVGGMVASATLSGVDLAQLDSHGGSLNPLVDSQAQVDEVNIAGNALALLTMGTGVLYSRLLSESAEATSEAENADLSLGARAAARARAADLAGQAAWANRVSRVSGFLTTGIGFRQASSQLANIIEDWGQMTPGQQAASVMLFGVGLAEMAIGAKSWRPDPPEPTFETLVNARANELLTIAQQNKTAGPGATEADYIQPARASVLRPIIVARAQELSLDNPGSRFSENLAQAADELEAAIEWRARYLSRTYQDKASWPTGHRDYPTGRPPGADLFPDDATGRTYRQVFRQRAMNDIYRVEANPIDMANAGYLGVIRGQPNAWTVAGSRDQFIQIYAEALWRDAGSQGTVDDFTSQAEAQVNAMTEQLARDYWRAAGRPNLTDPFPNDPAGRTYGQVFHQQAEDALFREAPNVRAVTRLLNRLSPRWMRTSNGSRPNPDDGDAVQLSATARYRALEYFRQMGNYAKIYAITYGAVNGAALLDMFVSQVFFQPIRKTVPVNPKDAYSQLLQLEANTTKYMSTNYDDYSNANGDLMEIKPGSSPFYAFTNSPYYFRRVPDDLYEALVYSSNSNVAHSHTFTSADGQKTTLHGVFVTEMYKGQLLTVEIRPPWIDEATRDAGFATWPGSSWNGSGFDWREQFGFGPIEGMRVHLDIQLLFNDRYVAPTATTLRIGLPSLTQGWQVGLRQQNTSYWSRINVSFNALDINAAKVFNLTQQQGVRFDPEAPGLFETSGIELTGMNNRLYLSLGNRDRVRLDYNGVDYGGLPGGQPTFNLADAYARVRETPFVELGVGADFAEASFFNGSSIDLNAYYELQFYPLDLRMQLNMQNGDLNTQPTLAGFVPPLQIDPALQLTVSGDVPWADLGDIPRIISPNVFTAPSNPKLSKPPSIQTHPHPRPHPTARPTPHPTARPSPTPRQTQPRPRPTFTFPTFPGFPQPTTSTSPSPQPTSSSRRPSPSPSPSPSPTPTHHRPSPPRHLPHPEHPPKPIQYVVLPIDGLNVRAAPSIEAHLKGVLREGSFVMAAPNDKNPWIYVTGRDASGQAIQGWVETKYIKPHPAGAEGPHGRINPALAKKGDPAVTVQPGESIWSIAETHGFAPPLIERLNSPTFIDPNLIFPGDDVYLPRRPA